MENAYIQSRLMRPPLRVDQSQSGGCEEALIEQLGRLVSIKGADLMLSSTPEEIQGHQRLRHTVNPKMWKWKVISGWKGLGRGERINFWNSDCLRWRLERVQHHDCCILHLTDSLVCLHSMTSGRTSSRRLTRTLCRINSLLLAHNVSGLSKYVSADLNHATRRIDRRVGRCEPSFATQARRAKDRQKLGRLKQLTVQPSTRVRYKKALNKFLVFLKAEGLELPSRREHLDSLVMEYIEHLWLSGEGRGLAADTLASLQDYDAKIRGHLPGAWRLVKTWVTHELPNRAPPVPELVLQRMVGWSLNHGHFAFATSLLVCFYGVLRTGGLLDVVRNRVEISAKLRTAVIAL